MKKVPTSVFLGMCKAVMEAAKNLGDDAHSSGQKVWEVSDELLTATRQLIVNHPEVQVRELYLEEIDKLLGGEEGDGC